VRLLEPVLRPAGWWDPAGVVEGWWDNGLAPDLPPSGGITYVGQSSAVNTTAGTSLPITYPSGIQSGDVLVVWVTSSVATAPGVPSGFTSITTSSAGGSSPSVRLAYRVCDGSETGTLSCPTNSSTSHGQLLLFRGVDTTSPVVGSDVFGSATATTAYTIPSIASVTGAAVVYAGAGNNSTGAFTPPTVPGAFTETYDSVAASPNSGSGYYLGAPAGSTGAIDLTRTNSLRGGAVAVVLRAAGGGGGQSASLTPVASTDAPQPLGRVKSRSLTPVVEIGTPVALVRRKATSLTPVTVTDTPQPLTRRKAKPVVPATVTDAPQALTRTKARTLTPATTTDTPVALTGGTTGGQQVSLTPATTTDTPQPLGRVKSRSLTPAIETDAPVALGRSKRKSLTPATTTDTPAGLTRRKAKSLGVVTVVDAAVALTRAKARALVAAVEAALPVALRRTKSRTITPATVTDTPVPLTGGIVATGEVTIVSGGPGVRRYSAAFSGDRYGAELVERGRYAAVAGRIRYDAEPALDRVEAQA